MNRISKRRMGPWGIALGLVALAGPLASGPAAGWSRRASAWTPGRPAPRALTFTERTSELCGARLTAVEPSPGRLELRVEAEGAPPGPTWILLGLGGAARISAEGTSSRGELLVGPPYRMLSRGADRHVLSIADLAAYAGSSWSLQAAAWTPRGIVLSNALDVHVPGSGS